MKPIAANKGLHILWTDASGTANQALFDVTISDEVESILDATEHPVEKGGDITDNARLRMKRFSFEVVISDTPLDPNANGAVTPGLVTGTAIQVPQPNRQYPLNPLGAAIEGIEAGASAIGQAFGGSGPTVLAALTWPIAFDGPNAMLTLLHSLQESVNILTITTTKYTFTNVLLTAVKQMRDKEIGSGARYRLEFKQLRMVTLEFTDSPEPDEPRGASPKNKGAKSNQQQKTVPHTDVGTNLINKVAGALGRKS